MEREAQHAAVHGVAESWTRLSDRTELNLRDFPSDPVVKNTFFCCRGGGLIPGWENKIPYTVQCSQNKIKSTWKINTLNNDKFLRQFDMFLILRNDIGQERLLNYSIGKLPYLKKMSDNKI